MTTIEVGCSAAHPDRRLTRSQRGLAVRFHRPVAVGVGRHDGIAIGVRETIDAEGLNLLALPRGIEPLFQP